MATGGNANYDAVEDQNRQVEGVKSDDVGFLNDTVLKIGLGVSSFLALAFLVWALTMQILYDQEIDKNSHCGPLFKDVTVFYKPNLSANSKTNSCGTNCKNIYIFGDLYEGNDQNKVGTIMIQQNQQTLAANTITVSQVSLNFDEDSGILPFIEYSYTTNQFTSKQTSRTLQSFSTFDGQTVQVFESTAGNNNEEISFSFMLDYSNDETYTANKYVYVTTGTTTSTETTCAADKAGGGPSNCDLSYSNGPIFNDTDASVVGYRMLSSINVPNIQPTANYLAYFTGNTGLTTIISGADPNNIQGLGLKDPFFAYTSTGGNNNNFPAQTQLYFSTDRIYSTISYDSKVTNYGGTVKKLCYTVDDNTLSWSKNCTTTSGNSCVNDYVFIELYEEDCTTQVGSINEVINTQEITYGGTTVTLSEANNYYTFNSDDYPNYLAFTEGIMGSAVYTEGETYTSVTHSTASNQNFPKIQVEIIRTGNKRAVTLTYQ